MDDLSPKGARSTKLVGLGTTGTVGNGTGACTGAGTAVMVSESHHISYH